MIKGLTLEKDKLVLFEPNDFFLLIQKRIVPVWIRVTDPTIDEIQRIGQALSFTEDEKDDFKDFLDEGRRSRVEKGKYIEIIYGAPVYEKGDIVTEELAIYVYDNTVLTVEPKNIAVCDKLFSRARQNKGKYLFKRNGVYIVSELLDEINSRFLTYVNKIDSKTDIISSKIKSLSKAQIESVSSSSTTLSFFNQVSLANLEVVSSLKKMHHPSMTLEDRSTFEELYFDVLQIIDALKIQREIIMNIFNLQSMVLSNQMNAFMKKLTALALIIMVPTLISGIYGMNLTHLPFANSTWGFLVVFGFMIVITTAIFFVFKKQDWL